MKRCPQCLFIYPESDEQCDFDNTPLVVVNDSEIEAAIKPRRRTSRFALLAIAVAVAAAFGTFVLYKLSSKSTPEIPVVITEAATPLPQTPAQTSLPPPPVSPSPTPKPSPTRAATSHTSSSLNPISTSADTGAKRKPVIYLSDGGKIEADEVWRTRGGVWYRRNGMVTLLKHSRVKSIANQ